MNLEFSLAIKLLLKKGRPFRGDLPFAVGGLALGVASLITAMAIMSGFETTLQRAVVDVTGHAQVIRRADDLETAEDLERRIRVLEPNLVAATPFVYVEGVLAKKGRISGVVVQGLGSEEPFSVVNLGGRVLSGTLMGKLDSDEVLIGRGIAQSFSLSVGDDFRLVIPIADPGEPTRFHRNVGTFRVRAIVDLGKYDWNERFIVMGLEKIQEVAQLGGKYSGLILKFSDAKKALQAVNHLSEKLGLNYWVRAWRDLNENLFEAVEIERIVVFFVVLLIVLVAAFNMMSFLYVHVIRRYRDIAIFKTLGLSKNSLVRIFSYQGLLLAIFGIVIGIFLGGLLVRLVPVLIEHYGLIQGSVYKIEKIQMDVRLLDVVMSGIASLILCLLATLAPALKGAQMKPVEGLSFGE